ncbi:uncharacterized protein [Engystomops pustulosus]
MESLKDEQGPEQEAAATEKTVTSTEETEHRGLSDERVMESDSGLQDDLKPPTFETLTHEIVSSGTQASVSPCHKEWSQGSQDASPSGDNTPGIRDATLSGETAAEERPVDHETRHSKENNEMHFTGHETSSDDMDEWETASEESVAFDSEPLDQERVIEDTGSYELKKENEEAGPHSTTNISEEIGPHGQETVSEDTGLQHHVTLSEDIGGHGQETTDEDTKLDGQRILSEDTGFYGYEPVHVASVPHGHEMLSEDGGPQVHETMGEETRLHDWEMVNKDAELHSQRTSSEDTGSDGHQTLNEDFVSELHGQEKSSEDSGAYGHERLNEPLGYGTVSKNTEPQIHESVSEEAAPHGQETFSEEAAPHGQETFSEEAAPHGQETFSEEAAPHGHETFIEEAAPHGHETFSEEAAPHGHETFSEEAAPHGHETFSEEAAPHGHETFSEEAAPHGHETFSEEAAPHGHETFSEEAAPHGHETFSEEAAPHGHETFSEEAAPHGHETFSEEAAPHGHETFSEEAAPHGHETFSEEAAPHGHETFSEEAAPHGHETFSEEAELHNQESVREESCDYVTVSKEAGPQDLGSFNVEVIPCSLEMCGGKDETIVHEDMEAEDKEIALLDTSHDDTSPHCQEMIIEKTEPYGQEMFSEETSSDKETETIVHEIVTDLTRCKYDEGYTEFVISLGNETVTKSQDSNIDGQPKASEAVGGTGSHEIDEDCKICLNDIIVDHPNENIMSHSVNIQETARDEINSDSTYNDIVLSGIDGAHSDQLESISQERDPDMSQNVYIETINDSEGTFQEETEVAHTGKGDDIKTEVYAGIDSYEIQSIYEYNVGENTLEETPDFEVTVAEDVNMGEISQRTTEILMEHLSQKREVAKKLDCEHIDKLDGASRVLGDNVLQEDDFESKQRLDITQTSSQHVPIMDLKITYLECEGLEEKIDSTETLVENVEGLELPQSIPTPTSEKLYMNQPDFCLPALMDKGQENYEKTLRCIGPTDDLGLGYNAKAEVQVVTSDFQGIVEPLLEPSGLQTEQKSHSKDNWIIGLQNQGLSDPEHIHEENKNILDPCFSRVDQAVPLDEPDHYKLEIFPIRLKGIELLSYKNTQFEAADVLSESIDTDFINQETTQQSLGESVPQSSTLDDIHPVIDLDQDTKTSNLGSKNTSFTDFEDIKLVKRQRSNTDPCLIQDHDENLQQGTSTTEGSLKGRLRSLTPPCDKFTSSCTPTSPKTLEQPTTSVTYTMLHETSHKGEGATSSKRFTFHPTQIFNPILLLGQTLEESGFYHDKALGHGNLENASQGASQSPPQDNQGPQQTQNSEINAVEPRRSAEETSNTKTGPVPFVAPVWLPPQPTRYAGDSGGVDKSLKPADFPLVRRATIRHKRSNVGTKPTAKRFSNANLPSIPQRVDSMGPMTSNLPKIQSVNVGKIQLSSKTRHLPYQQNISEETGQSRSSLSMEMLREEGNPEPKENSAESVLRRGTRSKTKPPSSDSSHSIHRRYSTFINSSNLLYQEYSDVALNQEIQRQKPGDSPVEDSQPSSPRVRRRILSSQDSYLQRLSISSADSLWQDLPKIRDSVTFMSMTRDEQKLQEAKFELIMSEALYLRSLNIAVDHFQRSPELQEVLSAQDRQWLFSRLSEVRDASSDFLFDLEEEFESNMYNFQVCDVVISHEPNFRRVYLPYVTNQSYQDRTFQLLMTNNPRFQQVLSKLESDPVCQRLTLKSFLILPFQRITRLRLLLQNILKRSSPGSTEELQATEAHNALEKLIRDCNESVQRMKDTEELILLNQKIQFECKIFPLISQSRRLVKHGEVTSLEFNSMSFKWKVTLRPVYLHLFNDCLLLSRVREGGRFVVFDHASEFRVERCEVKLHTNSKNVFRVFLRDSAAMARESSQDVREAEYIFRTETQSQKLRWICALSPPKEETDFWRFQGLPQVQCLKSYKARENDELSLEKADILMITKSSDDGWLRGIRLSDQQTGWFPQSNVQYISQNACLRNLQEGQRLQNARAKLQPTGAKGQ